MLTESSKRITLYKTIVHVSMSIKISKFKFLKLLEDGIILVNLHVVNFGHSWQHTTKIFLRALESFQQ